MGSFGAHLFLDIVAFHSWNAVMDYLRSGDGLSVDITGDGEESNGHSNDANESATEELESNNTESGERDVTIIGILGPCGVGDDIFSPRGTKVYEHSEGFVSLVPPDEVASDFNANNNEGQTYAEEHQQMKSSSSEHHKQSPSARIPNKSYPIHTRPFATNVCFLVSKDRRGLPIDQARLCDGFVHIPHITIFENDSTDGAEEVSSTKNTHNKLSITSQATHTSELSTSNEAQKTIITQRPLLNTEASLSIVLHHFTTWAGYEERKFEENQKFVKDARPTRVRYLGVGKNYKKDISECDNEDDGLNSALAFWKSEESSDY